jgi:hypothetical protein
MNSRQNEPTPPQSPGETEYLITDVEELVNRNVGNYLGDKPFRVKITDYMPEMPVVNGCPQLPVGIPAIEQDIIQRVAPGSRDFIGMDLLFTYPLTKKIADENPITITLKWSDGINASLALVDNHPIALVTQVNNDEAVLFAAEPSKKRMQTYLETIGLPDSIWVDDFKDLMGDIYSSRDIQLGRSATYLLDLGTTLQILHNASYRTNEFGDKELNQELCLNLDHVSVSKLSGMRLSEKIFRNMFLFERNDQLNQWKYSGAYGGKLVSGEFVDQLVQQDPTLGVPGSKLLEKAFSFLSQEIT